MGFAKSLSENTKGSIHSGPVWAFPSPPFRSISWGLFGLLVFPHQALFPPWGLIAHKLHSDRLRRQGVLRTLLQVLESLPQPCREIWKRGTQEETSACFLPQSRTLTHPKKAAPTPHAQLCSAVSPSLGVLDPAVQALGPPGSLCLDWRSLSLLPFSLFLTLISGRLSLQPPHQMPLLPTAKGGK